MSATRIFAALELRRLALSPYVQLAPGLISLATPLFILLSQLLGQLLV
jgi:hypothetical protein